MGGKEMKKVLSYLLACLLLLSIPALVGCNLSFGTGDSTEQLFERCDALTGRWILYDPSTNQPTNTSLVFDGAEGAMRFSYYKDGTLVRDGVFRAVYRGEGKDVATPLSIGFEIKNSEHRDWLDCYVDDFKTDFTQFTVMREERDLPNDMTGIPQAHVYRISELPFAYGTYVKEGVALKENKNDLKYANDYIIPAGTYESVSGAKLIFLGDYYCFGMMLRYENGDEAVEGIYTVSPEKDKLFVWIDYQPGHKPTAEEKEKYEMERGADFPPNYNLYGSFAVDGETGEIRLDSFYSIEGDGYDPTACHWQTGVYQKRNP